jgi:molybdate transport system substrate-binding protein
MNIARYLLAVAVGALITHSSASAVEIRVLSTIAVKSVMEDLIPRFERESGHRVAIQYGTTAVLKKQIEAGENFDVAIFTPPELIEEMIKQGRIAADTRSDFARTSVGVAVRRGTPKPDISSLEAFRNSLLAAKTIGYTDPARGGTSGVHLKAVIESFGIAGQVDAKAKLSPGIPPLVESIANGEVEIGVLQISEIVADPRLELVGPLPKGAEKATVMTIGLRTDSKVAAAGLALIRFLTSPDVAPVIKARGLEPAS